jgi:hypothetical protein
LKHRRGKVMILPNGLIAINLSSGPLPIRMVPSTSLRPQWRH